MSDNKTSSSGIGFTGALLIAFIVLKLCNVITWSWWWVLSPAWIGAAIVVIMLVAIGCYHAAVARKRKRALKKHSEAISGLMNSIDDAKKSTSKWQQRLDEMQEAKSKSNEFRANNNL